jgi:hypothetical protein
MSFNKGRAARAALEARERQESQVSEQTVNERLLNVLEATVANQATQNERLAPRENPNYVTNSPNMKPNGEQWAKDLKCDVYFGPIHLNRTPLTKAEVDALNLLRPVVNASVMKTDGSIARVTVRGREDAVGRLERLTIEVPMRKEDNAHLTYPGLAQIALELAKQAETVAA